MGILAVVLLACAVVLLVVAEWPRLRRLPLEGRVVERRRRGRKPHLRVIEGAAPLETTESDDFEASVQRDLERLPVIDDRDDRRRR